MTNSHYLNSYCKRADLSQFTAETLKKLATEIYKKRKRHPITHD